MSTFHFQQFSVLQKQTAMKVCTDTLLFGAMMPVNGNENILDIGAGAGVLSLMAAQLGAGKITAVELTREAYREAEINFKLSPWGDRLEAVHQSIQHYAASEHRQYERLICNPPFFENHRKSQDPLRKTARHTDHLSFADLIGVSDKLLAPQGLFYLLLPVHAVKRFSEQAREAGFYLIKQTDIRGFEHSIAKVSALTFSRTGIDCVKDRVTVYESAGVYTATSQYYLASFLLRFARKTAWQA